MIRTRRHPNATVSARRLEAYTDGVFAIAATLLVLDLTSRSFDSVTTDAELWNALLGIAHPLFTFVVSFALLSMMWITHVSQFEHIARVDSVGTWINNARLLFIVLVPFTSSLTTDYSQLVIGRVAMPLNFFLVIVTSSAQWLWAVRDRATTLPDITDEELRDGTAGSLSALAISTGVLLLSPFIGSIAFVLFVVDGPLTKLFARIDRRRAAS